MKKLIALAAMALSLSTLAISETDSWETIKAAKGVKLENTWAFVGKITNVFNVCVDGENLRTLNKEAVYGYGPHRGGDKDPVKVITGYKYYTYPINYTYESKVCSGRNDNRCKTVPVEVNQKLDRDIKVSKFVREVGSKENRRAVYKELFKKSFSIPNCQ